MASLSRTFLAHLPAERRERFASVPDLDGAIAGLAAQGRATWTEVPLSDDDFAAFLGRILSDDDAPDLGELRAEDLWIVCAFGRSVPGAAAALDRSYLDREAGALARLGAPRPMIEDILQEIRALLVGMQAEEEARRGYTGRGTLGGWLRVVAVRALNRRRERRARELMVGSWPGLVASPDEEPEAAMLLMAHKAALTEAFREALASLDLRDRGLLRYHFVEGLGIDRLGDLYKVHRSTAARWIERACRTLSERTREAFRRRISLSDETFQRMVGLIESQIGVELAQELSGGGAP